MTIKNSRDSEIRYYNIRVYAIIMKGRYKVLLSDEYMMDMKMTKFPGGGMNFGEGPADAMFREAMEEFGQEIRIIRHYYTTDFFQRSMFFPDHQLISIYWLVRFDRPVKFRISDKPFDFAELKNGNQSFRWCDIRQIQTEDLTFPIDRIVLNMLKNDVQSRKVSD
jgi:ADP-ribose pyrophosphatase YjhB (NUDIX family)